MNALTFEETNLLCIYNPGTRQGAIEALTEMRGHLQADEDELLAGADSLDTPLPMVMVRVLLLTLQSL